MDAAKAREILAQAAATESYEEPIPEDDAQAIQDAEELVAQAQLAWDQYVRGPEVEAILRLAANGAEPEPGNAEPESVEPEPKAEAPEPEAEAEEASEPDDDASDALEELAAEELVAVEPWENYDADKVGDIIEGIDICVQEDSPEDVRQLLAHIWAYESAHKDRVRVLRHLEKIASKLDEGEPSEEAEKPQEEPPPPPEGAGGEPDPAPSEDQPGDAGGDEEGAGDGPEAPAPDRERDADAGSQPGDEAPAPSDEDRPGEDEAEASAEDREEAADERVEQQPEGERDEIYESLMLDVEDEIRGERLHIPPPLTEEPPNLPFDLTKLSDKELQQFYGYFAHYAYRVNYLLLMEEGKARRCKQIADEMKQELMVAAVKYDEYGKPKTVTALDAEIETLPAVRKWRRRQHKHENFAHAYRQERDSYGKLVDSLSRLETMRQDEFERSGGRVGRGK